MFIILLTSAYPAQKAPTGTTPVVHYFAKEWVAQGHKVRVFHTQTAFPKVFYWIARPIKKMLDSKLGHLVPTQSPIDYEETKDGVCVTHMSLKKTKPHGRFPQKQLQIAIEIISSCIDKEGIPDCFVGHWDNPQLELLHLLKRKYNRPTCLVYHSNAFCQVASCYGEDFEILRKDIDLVGFRNKSSMETYCHQFGVPSRSFIASSGISQIFINAGKQWDKKIENVHNYIYVGAIVARKYPLANINALAKAYKRDSFNITFIGDGIQKNELEERFKALNCNGQIKKTGRIPRDEIIAYLKEADVFVMISKDELFGLVYLEAMALGCITIGSRNEGIDGIIIDGVNGFLCEAGNEDELCSIINKIRTMSKFSLMEMSQNAKKTAESYSDSEVAKRYIENLKTICAI